jgi:hypothetical protein
MLSRPFLTLLPVALACTALAGPAAGRCVDEDAVETAAANRNRYFGVLARTAGHKKFPWRHRPAAPGRYGKLSIKQRIFSSAARRTMFADGHDAGRRGGELKILC